MERDVRMTTPRVFEIIGFAPDWPVPLEQAPMMCAKDFIGVENHTSETTGFQRADDIYIALEMVSYRHLQFPGAQEAGPWVQKGFDCALHYFLERWGATDDPDGADMAAAKLERDADTFWYKEFSRGLILGLLSECWDDVVRLCSWPWVGLVPEYSGMGGDLEDEVALVSIVMAGTLNGEPSDGLDKLKAKIRKCRTKRPRLLMQLWDAVDHGDQSAFEEALRRSLEHFASGKRLDARDARVAERLALPQTAIYGSAMMRGLRPPNLPIELSAYLITRQSLGLDV
jgi:hypothetical protein